MGGKDQAADSPGEKEGQDEGESAVTFSSASGGVNRAIESGPQAQMEINAEKADELGARRSRWNSSWAALRYVSSLSRDDDIKIRDSDRITSVCLLIGSILTIIALVAQPLAAHRLTLLIAADALVFLLLLFYVVNRFGILHTLMPRQALLAWQLIMGAGFVGIYMTINLAVLIAFIVAKAG